MLFYRALFTLLRAMLPGRSQLALENLALRQQFLLLQRNSPLPRNVEPSSKGRIIALPQGGGLHHRYKRAA